MDLKIKTKFSVGDFAYRNYFSSHYHTIEILGIEIYINKSNEIEIYYLYKPYSDSNTIDTISQEFLYTEEEISD